MWVRWLKHHWIIAKRSFWRAPSWIALIVCVIWAIGAERWFPMAIWLIVEALFVSLYAQNSAFVEEGMRREARRTRERQAEDLEEQLHGLDIETRLRIREICQLEREIAEDVLSASPHDLARATLEPTLQQIEGLTDRAVKLAVKKRGLQRFLDAVDEKTLRRHAEELQAKVGSAEDEVAREQYQRAHSAKLQELEDYAAISRSTMRIDGQLESIECAFTGLKARIVRLKAAESTEWDEAGAQLESELQQLNVGVDALEGFVNEVLSVRSTAVEGRG